MTDEFALIDKLAARLGGAVPSPFGIGDDGAVVAVADAPLVVVMDTMVAGTHFRLDWSGLDDVAFKLFNSNASDVFAMGAVPTGWFLALTLAESSDQVLGRLADGFEAAIMRLCPDGCPLLGGDTTAGPALVLTVTMLGRLAGAPLTRHGAIAGQQIWIDGPVGLAAGGLAMLQQGEQPSQVLLDAHRRGWAHAPRWADDRGGATGAIDISDGLAADLTHLMRASGVGMELQLPLPGADALTAAGFDNTRVAALQLDGGDDYVRVVTAPRSPGPGWTRIGAVTPGEPALTVIHPDGSSARWNPRGYRHFAGQSATAPAGRSLRRDGTNG